MKISEDDFLICRQAKGKNFLLRVRKVRKDGEIRGILENDRHLGEEGMDVNDSDVLVNLGPSPEPGTVYGVDCRDVYRKTFTQDVWGDVHFLTNPGKKVVESMKKSLDKTGDKLSSAGYGNIFRHFCTEIRTKRGKYAGMYLHKGKNAKPNRMHFYLKDDHVGNTDYVCYHEVGHALRFNCLTSPKIYAAWVKLFDTSIQVAPIVKSDFDALFLTIQKLEVESIGEIRRALEDDGDILALKTAIRYISQVHKHSPKVVNTLLQGGRLNHLRRMWPENDIDVSDLAPIVSEYACTNVEELFAESFAFHMQKKKLPKSVEALLEKTLVVAKERCRTLEDIPDEGAEEE